MPITFNNSPPAEFNSREVDKSLLASYQFLQRLFPDAVRHQGKSVTSEGQPAHEFIFTVGEPMLAADVFGYKRTLEVGGPSRYNDLRTIKGEFKPTIVTNIAPGQGVDEVVNATNLPYPDGSFSTVMAINLQGLKGGRRETDLRAAFLREAYRVLEPGGMLLMSGAVKEDLSDALSLGYGIEMGNGCIYSWLAATDAALSQGEAAVDSDPLTLMYMEFLLHK